MLRPTFYSFETAKRAISAAQFGLDTVGHNISNVNTIGYTRQRVDQVSFSSAGYKSKMQTFGQNLPGSGSLVTGINQIRDPFLDVRFRNEAATYGELDVKSNGLEDINSIFDEILKDGSFSQLGNLVDAFSNLQKDPSSENYAMVVRTNAEQLAQVLNKYAKDLNNVETQQLSDLNGNIAQDVNVVLEQIAKLNEKIKLDHIYGNPSNELMDERNVLIDKISEYMDIRVESNECKLSNGQSVSEISIVLKGTDPPIKLVDGDKYSQLTLEKNADGSVKTPVAIGLSESDGKVIDKNINDLLTKGRLGGYIDLINGKGTYANIDPTTGAPLSPTPSDPSDSSFRGIYYYRQALNDFANTFAQEMNKLNNVAMVDNKGDPVLDTNGDPVMLGGDLFTSLDGSFPITAETLVITQAWRNNPLFIVRTELDPSDPQSTGKDSNVLRFTDALTKATRSYGSSDLNGTFQQYTIDLQAAMGLDKKLNDSLLKSSVQVISGLADQRDSISAVSVDEEATNMMTYQNYYNAAARYLTVLDEALDKIINGMGTVGR